MADILPDALTNAFRSQLARLLGGRLETTRSLATRVVSDFGRSNLGLPPCADIADVTSTIAVIDGLLQHQRERDELAALDSFHAEAWAEAWAEEHRFVFLYSDDT